MSKIPYEEAIRIERQLLELSLRAKTIANESGLTRRQIAERMGHASPSTVQRLIGGGMAYNATVETLIRFATACGYSVETTWLRPETGVQQPSYKHGAVISMAEYRRRDLRWTRSEPPSLRTTACPDPAAEGTSSAALSG